MNGGLSIIEESKLNDSQWLCEVDFWISILFWLSRRQCLRNGDFKSISVRHGRHVMNDKEAKDSECHQFLMISENGRYSLSEIDKRQKNERKKSIETRNTVICFFVANHAKEIGKGDDEIKGVRCTFRYWSKFFVCAFSKFLFYFIYFFCNFYF